MNDLIRKFEVFSSLVTHIGGLSKLVASCVSSIFDNRTPKMGESISGPMRKIISDRWSGEFEQPHPENPDVNLVGVISIGLKCSSHTVTGVGTIHADIEGKRLASTFDLVGKLREGRILSLEYRNRDSKKRQLGEILVEMSSDAHSMQGRFQGFGQISKHIVSGPIHFTRAAA